MTIKYARIWIAIVSLLTLIACQKQEDLKPSSILRLSTEVEPQTLDPRRVRDLPTITLMHMLYEGLMRYQEDGKPTPALAESIEISPDQKQYTFTLRHSAWTNGQPVTAQDFVETWKTTLHPNFPSPNAYQLYPIRGAQAAKEGRGSLEDIGVYAKDNKTLVVTLEEATPHFLHLTTTPFFYPVHANLREQKMDSAPLEPSQHVTNGPFQLETWSRQNQLTTIPNPHYWDRTHVRLDKIVLVILDNPTALQLFKRGELDWTGSPLSTLSIDALPTLKSTGELEIKPAAGVTLFRVNTEQPPFSHYKMRQAFALALNREDLVDHVLQGNQTPAMGLVPPNFMGSKSFFEDHDLPRAQQLFNEALLEQGLSLNNFPQVSIQYAAGERSHKIAQVAQQQWKENLGILVDLQSNESKVYFDRLKKHEYQLGIGSWYADFHYPISFLEIFKLKDNGTNNTQWESPEYIALLNLSTQVNNAAERESLLMQAENLIMQEMPVIPLFFGSYNYVKNRLIKGVYFSDLGYLDLKNAYFENPSLTTNMK